jgi:hypothetical protein
MINERGFDKSRKNLFGFVRMRRKNKMHFMKVIDLLRSKGMEKIQEID